MSVDDGRKDLEFPCECVSSRGGYSDPWSPVAQNKLLPDGTKEQILCSVAESPKTIAQLAKELSLSSPSVFSHVSEMVASELLRESVEQEKRYPTERYYEPNFPVISRGERAHFEPVCEELAAQVAGLFAGKLKRLEQAFDSTALPERGWTFEDVAHYLFARVQRGARGLLEGQGALPPRQPHRNGVEWVFWAEEPSADGSK